MTLIDLQSLIQLISLPSLLKFMNFPLITQVPKMLTWMYFRTKVSRLSPKKLLDGCAQPSHQCSLACFKPKPLCFVVIDDDEPAELSFENKMFPYLVHPQVVKLA